MNCHEHELLNAFTGGTIFSRTMHIIYALKFGLLQGVVYAACFIQEE